MKNDYAVRAYRTETKYDTRDNLMSVLDVQVPAEALEFIRAAHNAQDSKDVTFTVQVVNLIDGDFRTLKFTSKGSKMKDFVPVATLEKWCDPHDNLTALFDRVTYSLNLIVEVRERQPDAEPLFDDNQQPDTVNAGVLNAPKTTLALPSGDIQDAEFFDVQAFLEGLNVAQLNELLTALDFWVIPDQPNAMELGAAYTRLKDNWSKLEGSDLLAQIKAELARNPEGGDAA